MSQHETELKTRHAFKDFLYWTAHLLVPVLTACVAILKCNSITGLVLYIMVGIAGAAVVYRFFCTHCPHYAREGKLLKCMFFWGFPKFFKPDPGRMSILHKLASFAAAGVVVFFPLYWLSRQPGLFVIYFLSLLVLFATIRRNECPRCVYKDCPLNRAPGETGARAE